MLGYLIGILGVLIALVSWLVPKPQGAALLRKYVLELHNTLPIYEDNMNHLAEHYVSVTLRNRTGLAIRVTSWGLRTPNRGNIVIPRQPVWGTQIPSWVEARSNITLHIPASDLRKISEEEKIDYSDMKAWIELADGKVIRSSKGVPLA